jgi:hypothetical protein
MKNQMEQTYYNPKAIREALLEKRRCQELRTLVGL